MMASKPMLFAPFDSRQDKNFMTESKTMSNDMKFRRLNARKGF